MNDQLLGAHPPSGGPGTPSCEGFYGVHHKHQPLHDKINPKNFQVASPLVIQGFSNFLGLFQGIMANPGKHAVCKRGPNFFRSEIVLGLGPMEMNGF